MCLSSARFRSSPSLRLPKYLFVPSKLVCRESLQPTSQHAALRDGLRPLWWLRYTRWAGWGHHPYNHQHQQGHWESLRQLWLHPNYQSPVWWVAVAALWLVNASCGSTVSPPHPLPGRCSQKQKQKTTLSVQRTRKGYIVVVLSVWWHWYWKLQVINGFIRYEFSYSEFYVFGDLFLYFDPLLR